MGQTACWGTGKLVECAWVSFGYGSIYDCDRFWVSLEAAKALARFDFGPPNTNCWDGTPEELAALPPRIRLAESAWHIHFTGNVDKSLEWWVEIEKEFGKNKVTVPGLYANSPDEEIGKILSALYSEDYAIKKSCREKSRIAAESHYGYRNPFFGFENKSVDRTAFDIAWNGDSDAMEELGENPFGCSIEDMLADDAPVIEPKEKEQWQIDNEKWNEEFGPQIIPSQTQTYNELSVDDKVICTRYDCGRDSYIHIPKDYYVFGGIRIDSKVDGEYHYTYGYVSPPEDWFKFGGYLRIRRMEGSDGARNPRTNNERFQRDRNYVAPPHNWIIFGGPLEGGTDKWAAHYDLWKNSALP